MTEEMRLPVEEEGNWTPQLIYFKDEKALSRKILTFLHKILLLDLSGWSTIEKWRQMKRNKTVNTKLMWVDHAEIYERSTLLLNEICVDMMGLFIEATWTLTWVHPLVSLATVLIQIQNDDKQKTLQHI